MPKLIMIRHGQSEWNLKNLFTGWVDVPLSPKGIEEALKAGEIITDMQIDVIFTTPLIRASTTAMLAMSKHHSGKTPVILHPGEGKMEEWSTIYSEEAKSNTIPVHIAWQLNERMYGGLQGLNKAEMMEKYGEEQVKLWRRSYDTRPPNEGESLKLTSSRSLPYFKERVVPHLDRGEHVMISAHGNSMRSIIMDLDQLSPEEVISLEIPTGLPIIYDYNKGVFTRETEIQP
ncbi:MAG: 2,3-bisphosphoglycerate-dependent phosphoglycerate mutase [Chlamydiae bacterium]|nr:2,3-bisphosphoglycerate-dependent phosphoglycerate mutase [Chlamydiota bacterium]